MSRLLRNMQRQKAQAELDGGWMADPLRLPFMRILEEAKHLGLSEAFRILVTCGACALTAGRQEQLYLDTIRGVRREDLEVIVRAFGQLQLDMEDRPFRDLLGPTYMAIAHKLDRDARGEFFTPHSLCYLLAKMHLGDDPREVMTPGEILTCNEPACGSGGMILAFAEVLVSGGVSPIHMRWVAQDLSALSCYATFVNTTLWGIPAQVVCGNTLSLETRWTWNNHFWHQARPLPEQPTQAEESRLVQMVEAFRALLAGEKPDVPEAAPKPEKPKPAAPFGAEFGPLFGGEW